MLRLSAPVTSMVPPPDLAAAPPPTPPDARASGRAAASASASASAAAAVARGGAGDPLSLAGLDACVADARTAALVRSDGPPDPASFAALRTRVARAAQALPPDYREAVAKPLLAWLDRLGPSGYAELLANDPDREGEARVLLDTAQAVLQHGEAYQAPATAAFQEVVSDLYDGFLSAEARRGVKPPDAGVAAPLVRWGSAADGPYTWPASVTREFRLGAAIVSLPAANAGGGLLAWPAVAHETVGHDIVEADRGLEDELGHAVRDGLVAAKQGPAVADYWADRVSESAADVLGVLNMGPAAAVSLVGYLRAMNGAYGGGAARLRNVGRAEDPHPADIARAYLAAETVRLLSFEGAGRWADRIEADADRDLGRIRLGDVEVTPAAAKASAAAVARAIAGTRMRSLEGRSLHDIQDWTDRDEAIVADLRRSVRDGAERGAGAAGAYAAGAYAAHAVAAGVYEAVAGSEPPGRALTGVIGVLDAMNARNPQWARRTAAA